MTLEELKELRLISNTNGTPSSSMTDEKWQKEIKIRKAFVTPYPKNITKMTGKYSKESGKWNVIIHNSNNKPPQSYKKLQESENTALQKTSATTKNHKRSHRK